MANGPAKAAILIANDKIGVLALRHVCTKYLAVAALSINSKEVVVVSAYFQFGDPTERHIKNIKTAIRDIKGDLIIGADVNARSIE